MRENFMSGSVRGTSSNRRSYRDGAEKTTLDDKESMKYNHVGIPTKKRFEGEIDLPELKMTVSDHENNLFGIQWQRYWENAPYPEIVKSVSHVAFEVEDMETALKNQKIIIAPNSPSEGLIVAFIEVNGAPVELMHYEKK